MAILSLEETGTGDQLQLRRLKKMKLDLKDKMQRIENHADPRHHRLTLRRGTPL